MKNSKRFINIKTVFVSLAMITLLVCASFASNDSTAELFIRLGQIAKEKLDSSATQTISTSSDVSETYAIGKNFIISNQYFNLTVEELKLAGCDEDEAQTEAEKILFEKFSLYSAAEKANCVVGDEYVSQVIKNTQEGIEKASNKSDFYNFLYGMELTEEEYWESQFENVKMYESISAYQDLCYQNYVSSKTDTQSNLQSNGSNTSWDEYWAGIVSSAISEQDITVMEK